MVLVVVVAHILIFISCLSGFRFDLEEKQKDKVERLSPKPIKSSLPQYARA